MRLTHVLRLINQQQIDLLKTTIRSTVAEAPRIINKVKEEKKKILYDRIVVLNKWYTNIIGLDEVRLYQDKVTSLQEQLLSMQEKRREVGRQLADVRQKSLELQDELQKVKRQEDLQRFLDLMRKETELLRLESTVARTFQEYDQTERELFAAFTNAIRDSHEKQRAQLEYTKYFGIILSITGSFLAFFFTMLRKHDLKMFMEEKLSELKVQDNISYSHVQDIVSKTVTALAAANKETDIGRRSSSYEAVTVTPVPLVPNSIYYNDEFSAEMVKVLIGTCVLLIFLKMISG
ncbi:hypothetical protein NQ317_005066 [Molorchus minor]|uniref:Coiled-coil domain-containing protein 51 n=1 Tax=Molorchus minor TaxID=1323400 RepID=A0ABQ9JWZ2_9CUCU|nr:hypothetical protein NQ317_005066 [Molorchus minor]